MSEKTLVITYDIGTTACKACLYAITDVITKVTDVIGEYPLITGENNVCEQCGDDWWNQICKSTRLILEKTKTIPNQIKGIAFCCQTQATIMVDKDGNALRNPMIWLDGRSTEQIDKYGRSGLIKIENMNARKLIKSLIITGGMAGTAKDPVWKYIWVKEKEPEIFAKTYKWLDVKDYLTGRCTGQFKMTYDSAHLTWVFDTRKDKLEWSKDLCNTFGIDMNHLPEVIKSTDIVGTTTAKAAKDLGLVEGIPVFGGGVDASLIGVGGGCTDKFDTHCYVGTSGWIVSNVDERWTDVPNFTASILGSIPGFYNYIAEQETAGVCLQWVRDHLALDEIGMYLNAKNIVDSEAKYNSLYEFLNYIVMQTEPGAGGLIFTPWLHGNRSPREDPYVRGMFFNIGLQTGKKQMIRAVLEGVAYHMRWMLEAVENKIPKQKSIRYIGGGAKSEPWCQIMADVMQRDIETVADTQNTGAVGAAMCCAVGLGLLPDLPSCKRLIPVEKVYHPRPEYKAVYDKQFKVFTHLYENNKSLYKKLNKTKQ
jgi:xylulokinase